MIEIEKKIEIDTDKDIDIDIASGGLSEGVMFNLDNEKTLT